MHATTRRNDCHTSSTAVCTYTVHPWNWATGAYIYMHSALIQCRRPRPLLCARSVAGSRSTVSSQHSVQLLDWCTVVCCCSWSSSSSSSPFRGIGQLHSIDPVLHPILHVVLGPAVRSFPAAFFFACCTCCVFFFFWCRLVSLLVPHHACMSSAGMLQPAAVQLVLQWPMFAWRCNSLVLLQ